MSIHLRTSAALAAALCTAAACAPLHRGGQESAVVVFANQSLDQADVYVVSQSGADMRLGTVMPGRTDTLRVSPGVVGGSTVSIVARILATSRAPRTGPISLQAGDRVKVTLPTDERILTLLPAVR